MGANGIKWQQLAANGSKWQQMAANGSNCKWQQIVANSNKTISCEQYRPKIQSHWIQIMKPHCKELQRTRHLIRASQPKEIINLARWRIAQRTEKYKNMMKSYHYTIIIRQWSMVQGPWGPWDPWSKAPGAPEPKLATVRQSYPLSGKHPTAP